MELARDRTKLRACSVEAARFVRAQYSADAMAGRYLRVIEEAAVPPSFDWPQEVDIPVPRGVRHPWMFHGWRRALRRQLKKILT